MAIIIGSARIGENGSVTGGAVGDQKQVSSTNDTVGEVSMQNFYNHTKGWYILRPKKVEHANKMAKRMKDACNNANLGYDQSNRYGVITYGIDTKIKTECDCSSLVRECIKEATGTDPGDFNTESEVSAIIKTGLFTNKGKYVSQTSTPVYDGDVLVTCIKGHTVIVVSGNPRKEESTTTSSTSTNVSVAGDPGCFNKYTGDSESIVIALEAVGCKDTSLNYRKKIAEENDIDNYSGTSTQNEKMLKKLKNGKLKNPDASTNTSSTTVTYYNKYKGSSASIVEALSTVGCKDTSLTFRKKIAKANGINNYTGTSEQNTKLIKKLKNGKLIKP